MNVSDLNELVRFSESVGYFIKASVKGYFYFQKFCTKLITVNLVPLISILFYNLSSSKAKL